MTKLILRSTLILIIFLPSSCTKDDSVGCWKCTITGPGSQKTRTVCDKTLQEASNLVISEETGYGGGSFTNVRCKRD
ncbi:MAG TPA: hypothetical protein VK541_24785 [Pedobacter sp.]|uniref:hypothetical protein n=1 Tax=Pedobacter sp. TaxID=1411316 RepID=UPI002C6E2BB8|nr:hypothetical protein [Pedobacter sp.]HMI05728.1 hypothetical protein [Pedobacter sp.]